MNRQLIVHINNTLIGRLAFDDSTETDPQKAAKEACETVLDGIREAVTIFAAEIQSSAPLFGSPQVRFAAAPQMETYSDGPFAGSTINETQEPGGFTSNSPSDNPPLQSGQSNEEDHLQESGSMAESAKEQTPMPREQEEQTLMPEEQRKGQNQVPLDHVDEFAGMGDSTSVIEPSPSSTESYDLSNNLSNNMNETGETTKPADSGLMDMGATLPDSTQKATEDNLTELVYPGIADETNDAISEEAWTGEQQSPVPVDPATFELTGIDSPSADIESGVPTESYDSFNNTSETGEIINLADSGIMDIRTKLPDSIQGRMEKDVIRFYWIDAETGEEIEIVAIGQKARFYIQTQGYEEGEKLEAKITWEDGGEFEGNLTELTFTGIVDECGIAISEDVYTNNGDINVVNDDEGIVNDENTPLANELEEFVVVGRKMEKIDYKGVVPTTQLKCNYDLFSFFKLAIENSVWKEVMKDFYKGYNQVWVHVDQLKDENGEPTEFTNTACTESYDYEDNPVSKYNQHRIVINSAILNKAENIGIDLTFLFRALLHEGMHTRRFERRRQTEGTYEGYPGHQDFLYRGKIDERHHNQMGAFNREELIKGMKEFDEQIRKLRESLEEDQIEDWHTVPDYHNDEWYEAMSWYGLDRTQAWEDFEKAEAKAEAEAKAKGEERTSKATVYRQLIKKQIERNKKGINGK